MTMEFLGHLAFVTGGGSGIGAQVCRDLAAKGASVVVADIRLKAASDVASSLPEGDGRLHLGVQVDVSKKSDVEAALAQVIKTYKRPADLIVNGAGVAGANAIEKCTEEELDMVVNINFKGTFLVTQVFGKALLEINKPGSIVNLSSILAYTCVPLLSAYCSSKAAVMQFTKVAAKEWGPRGVRVNSVHPGLIETPMTANTLAQTPSWSRYIETAALRRVGQPKDVSDVVLFVLSEKSGFVTGAQIEVSGQGVLS